MSYNRKYVRLLSALAGEFNEMDFCSYCPTEVINSFWSKHNWKSEGLNIFDLVLLARGNMHDTEYKATDINQFLRDFASFMIASYTIHHLNHDNKVIGHYMDCDDVIDQKEGIRMDFINRLIGLK